jgi:hypothetical protein
MSHGNNFDTRALDRAILAEFVKTKLLTSPEICFKRKWDQVLQGCRILPCLDVGNEDFAMNPSFEAILAVVSPRKEEGTVRTSRDSGRAAKKKVSRAIAAILHDKLSAMKVAATIDWKFYLERLLHYISLALDLIKQPSVLPIQVGTLSHRLPRSVKVKAKIASAPQSKSESFFHWASSLLV